MKRQIQKNISVVLAGRKIITTPSAFTSQRDLILAFIALLNSNKNDCKTHTLKEDLQVRTSVIRS